MKAVPVLNIKQYGHDDHRGQQGTDDAIPDAFTQKGFQNEEPGGTNELHAPDQEALRVHG